MECVDDQFQRRAIVGDRHFILADPAQPDVWALPGPVVAATDVNGVRRFGVARTISTEHLRAWAKAEKLSMRIEEKFPVVRRGITEAIAA